MAKLSWHSQSVSYERVFEIPETGEDDITYENQLVCQERDRLREKGECYCFNRDQCDRIMKIFPKAKYEIIDNWYFHIYI